MNSTSCCDAALGYHTIVAETRLEDALAKPGLERELFEIVVVRVVVELEVGLHQLQLVALERRPDALRSRRPRTCCGGRRRRPGRRGDSAAAGRAAAAAASAGCRHGGRCAASRRARRPSTAAAAGATRQVTSSHVRVDRRLCRHPYACTNIRFQMHEVYFIFEDKCPCSNAFLPLDAMLSAVYAVVVCLSRLSVCLSVCVWVCHTPVLYQYG